jgi:septum site-determining protein MinD
MGRVYAVASAKGGVGKTTTAANLGVALADAGRRVVVVDADLGMPNLGRMLGVAPDGPTLHDVLADDATPLDAVYEGPSGVDVVPGTRDLERYADADPRRLRATVSALADEYDVVLVDTGAGLSHDTVLPLGLADAVLLVSTPSPDALGDTGRTSQLADHVDAPVAGLVLTRVDPGRVDVDALVADLSVDVVGIVPEDPAVDDAGADGEPIVIRDPESPATAAYRALADAFTDDGGRSSFDRAAVAAGIDTATEAAPDVAGADTGSGTDAGATVDTGEETTDTGPDTGTGSDADTAGDGEAAADGTGSTTEADATAGPEAVAAEGATTDEPDEPDGSHGTEDGGADDLDITSVLGERDDRLEVAFGRDEGGAGETEEGDETETDTDVTVDEAADGADPDDAAGGLAATLADVESRDDRDGAGESDDPAPERGTAAGGAETPVDEPIPVAEAEADTDAREPERGREHEDDDRGGVTFDSAPDTDETGVTIQPDEAPTVPDAEAVAGDAAGGPDEAGDGDADAPPGADDEENASDGNGADDEENTSDGKKGLFGRFFG